MIELARPELSEYLSDEEWGRYTEAAHSARFFDLPVGAMTREELLVVVGFMATDMDYLHLRPIERSRTGAG